jgi:hypothetical protein
LCDRKDFKHKSQDPAKQFEMRSSAQGNSSSDPVKAHTHTEERASLTGQQQGSAHVENAGNVKTKAGGGVPPSIIEALQKKLSQVISKITCPIVQSSNFI